MEDFETTFATFADLSTNAVIFLNGDSSTASKYIDICSKLYAESKRNNKLSESDPLLKLLVSGFDDEQIWQQIDLFNSENIKVCSKGAALSLANKNLTLSKDLKSADQLINDEKIQDSSLDESELSESTAKEDDVQDEEDFEEEEEQQDQIDTTIYEKTEVDDDFFSLRQMEKFLEKEETGTHNDNSEDIDLFEDIPSTDDEQQSFDSGSDSENDVMSTEDFSESAREKDKKSARHVKYHDFFHDIPEDTEAVNDEKEDNADMPKSNYEKQELKLSKKINHLEERAVGEADWQMKGEVLCHKRPFNSLLEEVVSFERTERPAPEITDEHTQTLESIICQRIKDKAWDDVEKKIKDVKNPHEFKKKIVLDSEQSKLSLQEVYEKEYISKFSKDNEEKEDPSHTEIKSLMKSLFSKLDALSNFHFQAAPSDPEIKVITNLPSIAMEEVQPVTHTDANILAPEEVYEKKELKAQEEKTSTDRKRERRKKSLKQKFRAKARLAKLERLADTNDKLKTVQAIKKLEQAAKTSGSQTTIIKNSKDNKKRVSSSKSFFTKLDERSKVTTGTKPKRTF